MMIMAIINAAIITVMAIREGKIIIRPGANVWPHELKTAEALADAGYTVEFVRRSEEQRAQSADALMLGEVWEMKAPRADKASAIDKNGRKALHQSKWGIFDSRCMKMIPDSTVERELRKSAQTLRSMRRLLFVNRKAEVIVIK